jgi:hypothetical protein
MKRVIIVVVLIVGAAVLGLWRSHGGVREGFNRIVRAADEKSPGGSSDEIRKTFELKPGALVEIQGINGRVDLQTSSDGTKAEVYVRRTGDDPSSLTRREMIVEQTSEGIRIRSKQNHTGLWDHLFGKDPKEEVTIKAPRAIALTMKGINGRINTGDIDGALEVKGVNGKVELGSTATSAEIGGVNGSISVGLTKLGERGARISGVNGGIELRLSNSLNADLNARGMNGNVRSEIPEVKVEKEDSWSRYSARIGKGGPSIDISGINGNVRLTKGETNTTASSSTTENKVTTVSEDVNAKSQGAKNSSK